MKILIDQAVIDQALEALKEFGEHYDWCHQFPTYAFPENYPPCNCGYDDAITALRQAKEQPTSPPECKTEAEKTAFGFGWWKALESQREQAQQAEPVVWMYQDKSTHEVRFQKHMSEFVDHSKTSEVPLYGEPLANHELQCVCGAVWCGDEMVHLPNKTPSRQPLAWQGLTPEECHMVFREAEDIADAIGKTDAKLRNKNMAPTRKPLTDEEIKIIWRDIDGSEGMLIRFARAIEAAHGIKGDS